VYFVVFLGAAPGGESLYRQATHRLGYSGCFWMNRLAGLVVIARRRGLNTRFKFVLSVWRELFGGKSRGGFYELIWCRNVLISSVIDMEIQWNSDQVVRVEQLEFDVVRIVSDWNALDNFNGCGCRLRGT